MNWSNRYNNQSGIIRIGDTDHAFDDAMVELMASPVFRFGENGQPGNSRGSFAECLKTLAGYFRHLAAELPTENLPVGESKKDKVDSIAHIFDKCANDILPIALLRNRQLVHTAAEYATNPDSVKGLVEFADQVTRIIGEEYKDPYMNNKGIWERLPETIKEARALIKSVDYGAHQRVENKSDYDHLDIERELQDLEKTYKNVVASKSRSR